MQTSGEDAQKKKEDKEEEEVAARTEKKCEIDLFLLLRFSFLNWI